MKLTSPFRTGFFQVWMGFLCFIYMICALRTNIVFVGIFAESIACAWKIW